jgi:pimeloyl-ACP methyl ester carboxylesterase
MIETSAPAGGATYTEHFVNAAGTSLRYYERGCGTNVVHLHGGGGLAWSAAHQLLSERCRVLAFESSNLSQTPTDNLAEMLETAFETLGLERYSLWGASLGTQMALQLALRAPDRVETLVLEAPNGPDPELATRLGEITAPTLVVCGTDDGVVPPELARRYRELLPNSFLMFVWAAGHQVADDRPEAFVEVVGDFVARRQAFMIDQANHALFP